MRETAPQSLWKDGEEVLQASEKTMETEVVSLQSVKEQSNADISTLQSKEDTMT